MAGQRDVTRRDGACAAVQRRSTLTSARADRTEPRQGRLLMVVRYTRPKVNVVTGFVDVPHSSPALPLPLSSSPCFLPFLPPALVLQALGSCVTFHARIAIAL